MASLISLVLAMVLALSRAETATLVRQDLAKSLKVTADQITIVSQTDRQWPDLNLGCPGRKPLAEPAPVPGFSFTLNYAGREYIYHSDRGGRFRRCDATKPTAQSR